MNIPRPHLSLRIDRARVMDGVTVVAAGAALMIAGYAVWRFNKLMPIQHLIAGAKDPGAGK